jgi:ATP-binding cassette subfamily F protein uup
VPPVISVRELSHRFGARPLFEGISFTLSEGERVGLIGPNGAGKSTLLKIVAGALAADRGDVVRRSELRVAYVEQVPALVAASAREAVAAGLAERERSSAEGEARVAEWLNRLELDPEMRVEKLSGGWQKRVAFGRALASEPELLLLDEPTNHLDVESILWLERLLANAPFATLTVTHDRAFLQRVSTRILELSPRNEGGLLDVAGDYAAFLEHKEQTLLAQEKREEKLRNTLRRETEWLRRGAAARSTKQRARIQRAGTLADEVGELAERNRSGVATLDFQSSDGNDNRRRRLVEARGLGKKLGERALFDGVDLLVTPKSRIGLIGPNGCGKTTLLRVLLGQEAPTSGELLRAENLVVAYFEQNRAVLEPEASLADSVCPQGDYVHFRGSHLHRHGYLERFLFRAEQMGQPVKSLSGGEQSRLLIARLMLTTANVLVLDEPTNDLDLATLGVLEDALASFEGAVLLVTHDRYFLDQVTTELLAFHTRPGEEGRVTKLSGLDQWEAWHETQLALRPRAASPERATDRPAKPVVRKKLSFKDQRDFDTIEARIEAAEAKLRALEAECALPDVVSNAERLVALDAEMTSVRSEVERLYSRWAELDAMR